MKRITYTSYYSKPTPVLNLRKPFELIAIFVLLIVSFLLISLLKISFVSKSYAESLPHNEVIISRLSDETQNSLILDRNGELLYEFADPYKDRLYVDISEVPDSVKIALMAAEDEDFYNHNGVDYMAVLRSAFVIAATKGENIVGGSTITQQLVKNTVLSADRTVDRKIKEMLVSFFIERQYEKDQILELYLNSVSFGGRVVGIKTAARTYFNKDVRDLTLQESVFLVSLIQSPGKVSPLFASDKESADIRVKFRMKYIYKQLIDRKEVYSKLSEIDDLEEKVLEISQQEVVLNPNIGKIYAPHFVFYVKDILEEEYGITERDLYTKGYRIVTSLDREQQIHAEKKLLEGVDNLYDKYGMQNAALVELAVETGDLLVMVGSKDYFAPLPEVVEGPQAFDPHVNVALSPQNAGSTLKPFITYLALEQGKLRPDSVVMDKPINFAGYSPKNYDGSYKGAMTLAEALQQSRNTPFVQVLNTVGLNNFLEMLNNLGYKNANGDRFYGLAMAIGGFDTNLLEHAYGYSAFANAGAIAKPRPILLITDSNNEILVEVGVDSRQVLGKGSVAEVNKILEKYGPDGYSGKTGTTDENRDTYFFGYNRERVTGIWMGNNNNSRMAPNAFGSTTAEKVFESYVSVE